MEGMLSSFSYIFKGGVMIYPLLIAAFVGLTVIYGIFCFVKWTERREAP